jgi:phosphoglycolate phosphatase-like HAD superfamily hydrolase
MGEPRLHAAHPAAASSPPAPPLSSGVLAKLILFDIDGTLLHTRGAGRRAIHAALLAEFGAVAKGGVRFDGKTDPQIVRELLEEAEHPHAEDDDRIAAVCRRYVDLLRDELAAPETRLTIYPGVLPLLDLLEARGDALLGLLTGNVVEGARLKLRAAGIAPERFRVGAFGSDHADRSCLPAIAAERAVPLLTRVPRGHEIVIVGDTPSDMTCGRAVGARAIGVATGSFSVRDLTAAGAYAAFPDLGEPEQVVRAIYA